jgi:hypothetical protein
LQITSPTKPKEQEKGSPDSAFMKIIKNSRLTIKGLHIRFEDGLTSFPSKFAIGIIGEVLTDYK